MIFWPAVAFALVNINTANLEELDGLRGIGPVKAQAIIDYRTQNGLFYTIEDIMKVNGIGPVTYAGIKDDITVGDVPAPPTPPKATPKPATSSTKTASPKQPITSNVSVAASTSDVASTDPYYPLLPWLMALAAAFGLGIAGALYLRPSGASLSETLSEAEEFDIEY